MSKARKVVGALVLGASIGIAAPAFADDLVQIIQTANGRTEIWVDSGGRQYFVFYNLAGQPIGSPTRPNN